MKMLCATGSAYGRWVGSRHVTDARHRCPRPPRTHRTRPDRPRPRRQSAGADRRRRAARRRLARAAQDDARLPRCRGHAGAASSARPTTAATARPCCSTTASGAPCCSRGSSATRSYVNGHPDGMLIETAGGPARRRRPDDRDPPRGRRGDGRRGRRARARLRRLHEPGLGHRAHPLLRRALRGGARARRAGRARRRRARRSRSSSSTSTRRSA